ncbi:MAG TPA: hypothetical protein VIQ54_15205 [Polyangia bacterium]|jgi:hypothetical protein
MVPKLFTIAAPGLVVAAVLAAGCGSRPVKDDGGAGTNGGGKGGNGAAGATGAAGSTGTAGSTGAGGAAGIAGTSGGAGSSGAGGTSAGRGGTAGTAFGGTGGASGAGGAAGASGAAGATGAAGRGGTTGKGGSSGTGATGNGGSSGGGAAGKGGASGSTGGTSAGRGGDGVGGTSAGRGGSGGIPGPECTTASDCKLVDDCCTCAAIPVGATAPACGGVLCKQNQCPARQLGTGTVDCVAGRCVAGFACDATQVICKVAAPVCPAGEVPVINDAGNCYVGTCAPATECKTVSGCGSCTGANDACVSYETQLGIQHHCVAIPPECGGSASCSCFGAATCLSPYRSCREYSGLRGVYCSCPNC